MKADQASLNTKVKQGKESTTFQLIKELRQTLPHHTFLQYTATPQALLLLNVINLLSPNFVGLLTPGLAYTGGKIFFEKHFELINMIPESEVPSKDNPIQEFPESLKTAMLLYYLGVAVGLYHGSDGKNRSMMIHPSKDTMVHENYAHWVRQIQANWKRILMTVNPTIQITRIC